MLVRVSESSTTAADATAAFSKVRNAFPLSRSPTCFTDWCVAIARRPCGDGRRGLLRGLGGIRGADGGIAAQAWRRSTSARPSSRWARCARRCRWTRRGRPRWPPNGTPDNGGAVVGPQRAVQGRASPAGDRQRCSRCTRWPRAAKWASCSAGTESSLIRCRWAYGAVRSGVRAAAEMIQRERLSAA